MGIFSRLSHEIIDIIEWQQSDSDTMVYHYPRYRNKIKYGAKLTVREGQTAVFVNEGKVDNFIADVFPPGIYALETAHLPILSSLQHWEHGVESPFKAEVYFFNTTDFLDQQWGTKQPVMLADEQFGIVRLRAFGSYTLRISDAEVLLRKLISTDGNFAIDEINTELNDSIATHFAAVLTEANISLLSLPTQYSKLATQLKDHLDSECRSYGLEMGHIYLESVLLPENVQHLLDKQTDTGMNAIGDSMNHHTQMQTANPTNPMEPSGNGNTNDNEAGGNRTNADIDRGHHVNREPSHADDNDNTPPPLPKIYYLMLLGERVGPMTISTVYDKLHSGEAEAYTMIWRKGMGKWQTIESTNDIDLSQLALPPTE